MIKKLAKQFPDHYLTLYVQGMFAASVGNVDIALKFLQNSFMQNADYAPTHALLSEIYRFKNNKDACILHSIYLLLPTTNADKAQFAKANHLLNSMIKHWPPYPTPDDIIEAILGYFKAVAQLKQGEYQRAIDMIERFMVHQPNNYQAIIDLAGCYAMLNEYDQSRECYLRALAIYPDGALAQKNIAKLDEFAAGQKQVSDIGFYGTPFDHRLFV